MCLSPFYGTPGHYIPMLAKKILVENSAGNGEQINLKGFAIGNPYTVSSRWRRG